LAKQLSQYKDRKDVVILALPRGGVPVAFEVAKQLTAPLDIFLVRKLGLPGHEELAMGAIASGGIRVINEDVVRSLSIPQSIIENVAQTELQELERRERAYRGDLPEIDLEGKIAILIDDGLATGASMRAAVEGLKELKPARIIIAVPTASAEICAAFENIVDDVVCAETPEPFLGVGLWYDDFSQTTDEEVSRLLEEANTWVEQIGLGKRQHSDQ
jgi:predicted phosphoribosyltransferase